MRITYDFQEFFRTTGLVIDLVRVRRLGLETKDVFASFRSEEMDDVLDFCASHPEFHVVSYLGEGIYINRYDARGFIFQLAEGDADPTYVLRSQLDVLRMP